MKRCTGRMNPKVLDFARVDDGPGPAAYGERTTIGRNKNRMANIPNEPAYSIRPLLPERYSTDGPGPVYNLARLTRRGKMDGPKYSMAARFDELADTDNPGPAVYVPRLRGDKAKIKILLPLKDTDPVSGRFGRYFRGGKR